VLVVDAGPLYAAADRGDRHHQACVAVLRDAADPVVVPALVVTEVAYLLGDRLGARAEARFARSLGRGELLVECPTPADWGRISELCETYADLPLGVVDASVIAAAERLGASDIATLDRRHFPAVRPAHREAFTLLP
jgi:uncharacterized protein